MLEALEAHMQWNIRLLPKLLFESLLRPQSRYHATILDETQAEL